MSIPNTGRLLRLVLALLMPLAAGIVQWALWSYLQPFVWFLFYPAVFFSAWIGGLPGGLAATAVSATLVWYYFMPPATANPRNYLSIGVFMVMGALFGYTQERVRKANRETVAALAATRAVNDQLEARVQARTVELAQASERVQVSEQRFRALIEHSADAIVLVDAQATIQYVTPGYCRVLGYAETELIGRHAIDLAHPDDLPGARQVLAAVIGMPGSTMPVQMRQRHQDGTWRWLEGNTTNLLHESGVRAIVANLHDITQRKRSELERETLLAIMQGLATTEDLFESLRLMHQALAKVIYAENFFVTLYHADTATFEEVYSVDQYDSPAEAGDFENSISAYVFRTGQPLLLTQARFDELTAQGDMALVGTNSPSWLGVPLKTARGTIGVMVVQDYERDDRYSEADRDFLASIASQVTLAVERRQAEEILSRQAQVLRLFVEHSPAAIAMFDQDMRYIVVSHRYLVDYDLGEQTLEGRSHYEVFPEMPERWKAIHRRCLAGATEKADEDPFPRASGKLDWVRWEIHPWYQHTGAIGGIILFSEVITERKRSAAALEASEARLTSIIDSAMDAMISVDAEQRVMLFNGAAEKMFGCPADEALGQPLDRFIPERFRTAHRRHVQVYGKTGVTNRSKDQLGVVYGRRTNGEEFPIEASISQAEAAGAKLYTVILRDITERLRAEAALRVGERQMQALVTSLDDVIFEFDEQGTYLNVWAADEGLLAQPKAALIGRRVADVLGEAAAQPFVAAFQKVVASGEPEDLEYPLEVRDGRRWFWARISPVRSPAGDRQTVSMFVRDVTERKRAEDRIENQVRRLSALRAIDLAITSSLDLRITLSILLNHVMVELGVDAAAVLLLNHSLNELEYAAGRGFRGSSMTRLRLKLGEGYAGEAALDRRRVSIPNLAEAERPLARAELTAHEKFVAYYAVPLVTKGQVKGVLEVFHRARLDPDPEWLDFLEMLAGQAAIAIDDAQLFDGLQRSNAELAVAYDATIEGWSRAMDLRDKATEGHTQRMTELTVALAQAVGMSSVQIAHMRRGALLHDIGNLGVPDAILLKPGKLTDEEWLVMRQHPQLAYDMLAPIAYLRPALDIPYGHHEKWDGTGYPRGLKGEAIPQAARLFAVVDVWDALRSDRPYRAAWPEDQVLAHIRALAGTHFDPQAVELFLKAVGKT